MNLTYIHIYLGLHNRGGGRAFQYVIQMNAALFGSHLKITYIKVW